MKLDAVETDPIALAHDRDEAWTLWVEHELPALRVLDSKDRFGCDWQCKQNCKQQEDFPNHCDSMPQEGDASMRY
jgi:hypothetical protein